MLSQSTHKIYVTVPLILKSYSFFTCQLKKLILLSKKKKSLVFWSSITLLSILDFCRHVKNVLQLHKTQKCIRENNLINIYNSSFSVNMHVVKHVYTSKRR